MTFVVNDSCIRCKIMDCVDVCPVDCFYEGENMLVIHPEECIDCGVCVPECPVDAIKPETEPGLEKWLSLMRLEGLNITKARGRWYVYFRDGGALLKGFDGSRDDLLARLSEPDIIGTYNARRKRNIGRVYADGTLGALVAWFKADCPTYADLSEVTRGQYDDAFEYLMPEFDAPIDTITQPSLYDVRDACIKQKWPAFANKMMVAVSSMFTQAVKRGKMAANSALGMDKAYKLNRNANREWQPAEWLAVQHAPQHIKTPLMLARYVGYRGQTISAMQWSAYQADDRFGKCFRISFARTTNRPGCRRSPRSRLIWMA